jgi:hypothetical protein
MKTLGIMTALFGFLLTTQGHSAQTTTMMAAGVLIYLAGHYVGRR